MAIEAARLDLVHVNATLELFERHGVPAVADEHHLDIAQLAGDEILAQTYPFRWYIRR